MMNIRYHSARTTHPTSRVQPRKLVDALRQFPLPTQLTVIICGFGLLVFAGINPAAAEAITGLILAVNAVIHADKGKPTPEE